MPSIPCPYSAPRQARARSVRKNKNKKPKEKPKQNTSPSANVSQSLKFPSHTIIGDKKNSSD
jgi:hypothetical protein